MALAALLAAAPPAAAEGDDETPRPVRWSIEAGGFGAVTGPASGGPAAAVELAPGGLFGRWGITARWRGFGGFDAGQATAGLTYEAAAARPRLVLSLHVDAGASFGDERLPVVGSGLSTRLWLAPPVYLGTDGTAYLHVDGLDSRLAFGMALVIGVGR